MIDGVILVKYRVLADPEKFASEFDLNLIHYFPNIQTIALKVSDFVFLEQKVLELSNDSRVLSAEVDIVYNPVVPE